MRRVAVTGAVLGLLAGAFALEFRRVVVEGTSMLPALEPGDRILVVRVPRFWPLPPGTLVALKDPRDPHRVLVKRVSRTRPGRLEVLGDNPGASTDSRHFGALPRSSLLGCCLYRYAPPERSGRL